MGSTGGSKGSRMRARYPAGNRLTSIRVPPSPQRAAD
jgi:hypothetical protein